MAKRTPKAPKREKQPFLSFGYWYDAAFGSSKSKPPKRHKKKRARRS